MSYIYIFLTSLIGSAIILYYALKHGNNPGAKSLMVFSVFLSLSAGANYSIYRVPQVDILFCMACLYLFTTICFTSILIFAIEFTQRNSWLAPRTLFILAIEPVLIQVLFWGYVHQYQSSVPVNIGNANLLFQNPWFLLGTTYTNILLLAALVLLAFDFSYKAVSYRSQTRFILAGISISLLWNNSFAGSSYLPIQDLQLISCMIFGISIIASFNHTRIMQVKPIPRESVVEHMADGWIVLDKSNNIIDINPMAEKILGKRSLDLAGQSAEIIFKNWPNLKNSLNESRPLDLKGSVQIGEQWTYLNIYISPLTDKNMDQFGKLIVWRDITERRIADEARQQARDEIFILLHSITSAAGRALNLDDFLQEIIYQIVYASHSQSIAVYLLEDRDEDNVPLSFTLAAQHGLPISSDGKPFSFLELPDLVQQVIDHEETLLVRNTQTDERIPSQIANLEPKSLLLIPMLVQGEILGFIGFTRETSGGYNQNEITRLEEVTDEVASFIESNRQRQLSIALAERQRLVRDLHDSVTQKLYALVMMSEAIRAGLKAGMTDMPAKVIDNMTENARQALKEMRLFLYQMQPVDFAKDGLALVIQQRLSAVEGHTDIATKISIDPKLSLPLEIQLALYFISQEALNNILKHSKAKNVRVELFKRRSTFTLEIEDDGKGFDPENSETGGLGIKSMYERAAQIDGKLTITSTPEVGSKISVTFQYKEDGRKTR